MNQEITVESLKCSICGGETTPQTIREAGRLVGFNFYCGHCDIGRMISPNAQLLTAAIKSSGFGLVDFDSQIDQMCARYKPEVVTFGKRCSGCPITSHLSENPYMSCYVWRRDNPELLKITILKWMLEKEAEYV